MASLRPPRTQASAITAARFGEADGLDDGPPILLAAIQRERRTVRRRAARAYAVTVVLVLATALLFALPLLRAVRDEVHPLPPAPVVHPFDLSGGGGSIIMALRGDPIMIVRQENARPRPIQLGLPAALSDGPGPIPVALRVRDTLISEVGGFMGKMPDDPNEAASIFAEGLDFSAEDIHAVLNRRAGVDGDARVAVYTLLDHDIAAAPLETDEAEIEAAVQAAALARGWITETRRGVGGRATTAAVLRELGANSSRLGIAPTATAPEVREVLLSAEGSEQLAALLTRNGVPTEAAKTVEGALGRFHGVRGVVAGSRVFLRAVRDAANGALDPRQAAVYEGGVFLGAVAISGDGWVVAAEPAIDPSLDPETARTPPPAEGYSVRDGIYSAALRNDVPEPVVREAIIAIGRTTDLTQPAGPGDLVDIVFTQTPRDAKGGGRVLYVGLTVKGVRRDCYVFKLDPAEPFGCIDAAGKRVASRSGMIAPVKGGRLTSKFGMRVHPVLKYARLHKGIDWGAPKGTPVMAVAAGTITFLGVNRGYGNYVMIAHDKHTTTAYAHLDAFEPGVDKGSRVEQGQRIGYLGSTGLSTGPHLHFEVYVDSKPVDPLTHTFAPVEDDDGSLEADTARLAAFTDRKSVIDRALGLGG